MTEVVDTYISEVISRGDEGSALLAAICAPTLKNSEYVDVMREGMNGLAVFRPPEGHNIAVFSAHGNSDILNPEEHAASMVDDIHDFASSAGIKVLGFADMIDVNKIDKDQRFVKNLGASMADRANQYGYSIVNGELAILGNRVNCDANVSGTAIGLVPKNVVPGLTHGRRTRSVFVFDPRSDAVYVNSDGEGTKSEFNERAGKYWLSLANSLVMKSDDAAKLGARIQTMFDSVERNNGMLTGANIDLFVGHIDTYALTLSKLYGFHYVPVHENVGERLRGWAPGKTAINVGGSAVSTIDGKRLVDPPRPRAGDYLFAVRGKPNPRSNGITDKRISMVNMLGERWHETPEGIYFLEFLAEPSTCFYPVFMKMLDNGIATSVYHMSGGAFNGKLARPLAQQDLYANVYDLFKPDPRERTLAEFMGAPNEISYAKWPMGNEAFVTGTSHDRVISTLQKYGLEGRFVGVIQKAKSGTTGVTLYGIKDSAGADVYFPGK